MTLKQLCLLFVLLKFVNSTENSCPNGCICEMVQNLRSAFCISEKLLTIEANIPSGVQFLDLSDNLISKLHDYAFKSENLLELVVLNLSTNILSQISLRAFEGLNHLQILDLSDNILQGYPKDMLETNLNLLKLYLGGNKLGYLQPEPILSSTTLQVLDISRNGISHIPTQLFAQLPAVTSIDITRNYIIQLHPGAFENLARLKSLDFGGNQLQCNEQINKLVKFLTEKGVRFENVCNKVEKFQRMVVLEAQTEKSTILDWNFDSNCSTKVENYTREVIVETYSLSSVFIVISFISGLLIGIALSCCYFYVLYIVKEKSRKVYRQPRDEYLLSERSFNLGLSTPVLGRSRRP